MFGSFYFYFVVKNNKDLCKDMISNLWMNHSFEPLLSDAIHKSHWTIQLWFWLIRLQQLITNRFCDPRATELVLSHSKCHSHSKVIFPLITIELVWHNLDVLCNNYEFVCLKLWFSDLFIFFSHSRNWLMEYIK